MIRTNRSHHEELAWRSRNQINTTNRQTFVLCILFFVIPADAGIHPRRHIVPGLASKPDRGRKRLSPSPPSEPCVQFSRTRLSSRWFPHRDWLADCQAETMVNSPWAAKKVFGQRRWSSGQRPIPGRFSCFRSIARSRRRTNPSIPLKVIG